MQRICTERWTAQLSGVLIVTIIKIRRSEFKIDLAGSR